MRLLTMTLLIASMATSHAAAAEITSHMKGGATFYVVSGTFESGDGEKFVRAATADKAIVILASPGGNLLSGITMGEHIRMKGYVTGVPGGTICASACALAWLGGVTRTGVEDSKIGFHAASTGDGDITSSGNALIGAYLNKIGVGYRAVQYITSPRPADMTWLSFSKARELGIDIVSLDEPKSSEPTGLGGAASRAERRSPPQPQARAAGDIRLTCVPLSREGKDPVVAITVSRVDNFWRIVHIAASGAQYDRGSQYEISREPGAPNWTGQHRRKRDTLIKGEVSRVAGKLYYNEKVMGGGELRADVTARCETN